MGNQLAPPQRLPVEHLSELPHVVHKETLGGGRFLKTLLCVHDNGGLVVVKVYYKRGESPPLQPYKQQLQVIRERLFSVPCPHVWPFQAWMETATAGYMVRQHMFANLYDRLSTRPFLSHIEKLWIAFQALHAVAQAHSMGVCHGDIKAENILVTSWNWVFLADFAPYKPTYLPADNPADYSFFFDTGGRRRCYIAPERFFEGSTAAINPNAPLQPEMDVFALGCALAELFLDGRAFFELSQLLAYRRREYDPAPALASIEPAVAALILHMIQLSPDARWSAQQYLNHWPSPIFPPYFEQLLHPFFSSVLALDADARMAAVQTAFPHLKAGIVAGQDHAQQRLHLPFSAALQPSLPTIHLPTSAPTQPKGPPVPLPAGGLLADVSTLLADAQGVRSRLLQAGPAPAAEDDGIFIDDHAEVVSRAGSGSAANPSFVVDELVSEEVWEYQVREPGTSGQWVSEAGASASSSTQQGAHSGEAAAAAAAAAAAGVGAVGAVARRKEDVVLPEGGWRWASEWQPDVRCRGCDGEGWQYRARPGEGAAGPSGCTNARGWLSECTPDCTWRRRRWVRQRRRKPTGPEPSPGATAAAVSAAEPGAEPERGQLVVVTATESSATAAATAAAADGVDDGMGGGEKQDRGMVLVAVLLCSLLRGCQLQESKRAALSLLFEAAMLCDDDTRLQSVVPYMLTQIKDPSSNVRALALRCLVQLMASLRTIPPSDAKVLHDYLLPSLSLLPNDPEEAVRVEYALGISHLAAAAHQHLLRMQFTESAAAAAAAQGVGSGAGGGHGGPPVRYDLELASVRSAVEKVVLELVTGTRSTAEIKRALLSHAAPLARFFGRKDINDLLLPLLITCLNAQEWQLRGAFFGAVASIGAYTGRESLDVFLLPCLEQALVDAEASVVADAVRCLAAVCPHLRKRSLLSAARKVAPLLSHYSAAVRATAIAFVVESARVLPEADVYTQLLGMVRELTQKEPLTLTDEAHLARCLRPLNGEPSTAERADSSDLPSHGLQLPAISSSGGFGGADAGFGGLYALKGYAAPRMGANGQRGPGTAFPAPAGLPASPNPLHSARPPTGPSHITSAAQSRPSCDDRAADSTMDGMSGDSSLVLHPSVPVYSFEVGAAAAGSSSSGGPRLRSGHSVAVDSIEERRRQLQERAAALREKLARDPEGGEAAERQQLERITAALVRLSQVPGRDVRSDATLTTCKLATLATRLSPHPSELSNSAAARLSHSLLAQYPDLASPTSTTGPPGVSEAVSAALSIGIVHNTSGSGMAGDSSEGSGAASSSAVWRPRGVLVAHLAEHRKAVNRLALSNNGAFLLSASDDETVKVWDLRRLERDVSFHSRLTYAAQSGRITAVTGCEDGQSVASASASGSIHVWRVEYTTRPGSWAPDRYTGIVGLRSLSPGEGAVMEVQQWAAHPQLLLYLTQRGGVHAWDLRQQADAWSVPAAPSMGLVEQLVADPTGGHWLLSGSSRGYLQLWDVRFRLCVNSWQHPQRCPIDAMALASAPPSRLGLTPQQPYAHEPPPPPGSPLVYIAASQNEVGLWDLAHGRCRQVLRTLSREETELGSADVPVSLQGPAGSGLSRAGSGVSRGGNGPSRAASGRLDGGGSGFSGAGLGDAGGRGRGGAGGRAQGVSGVDLTQLASEMASQLAVDQINSPQARLAGCRALLPLAGGQLLTAGSDRCVRYWEAAWPERSYMVCGPMWPDNLSVADPSTGLLQMPQHAYQYSERRFNDVPVIEETIVGGSPRRVRADAVPDLGAAVRCDDLAHADCVTALASAEATGGRLLLSGSRDGIVKVWR